MTNQKKILILGAGGHSVMKALQEYQLKTGKSNSVFTLDISDSSTPDNKSQDQKEASPLENSHESGIEIKRENTPIWQKNASSKKRKTDKKGRKTAKGFVGTKQKATRIN